MCRPNRTPLIFNPRSPCGERLVRVFFKTVKIVFQSTLPVRGATANALKIGRIYAFYYSISA